MSGSGSKTTGDGGDAGNDESAQHDGRKRGEAQTAMSYPTTTTTTTTTTTEGAPVKVRKPYTITKKREKWSDEEHALFVESLKKYGRAWRKIEEHIGTKTAVQIRSHAQKFFSKLQKEQAARGSASGSDAPAGSQGDSSKRRGARGSTSGSKKSRRSVSPDLNLKIPPARPKKKPDHPYPKKATSQQPSGGSGEGKSTGTAQNMMESATQAEHIANASSSAAVAAVLSVASDKMQTSLQHDLRAGYFGVPPGAGMFAQPGLFPVQHMMNPYVGMSNPAAGAQNPPQMSNPQQFINYINFLTNMWRQNANAMSAATSTDGAAEPSAPAVNSKRTKGKDSPVDDSKGAGGDSLTASKDLAEANDAKKSAFSSLGGRQIPTAKLANPGPYAMPYGTPEQFGPYFASIMQAAAMGYMGAQNAPPMVGMSGFMTNNAHPTSTQTHGGARSDAGVKHEADGSDGSDGSDDYKLDARD